MLDIEIVWIKHKKINFWKKSKVAKKAGRFLYYLIKLHLLHSRSSTLWDFANAAAQTNQIKLESINVEYQFLLAARLEYPLF